MALLNELLTDRKALSSYHQSEMAFVLRINFRREVCGQRLRQFAFFVQKVEHTGSFPLHKIDGVLVVCVLDLSHRQSFLLVQFLLLLQHAFVEELLQLLVAVVDAELLEAVPLEILEAGDVKDPHVARAGRERQRRVHPSNNVIEEARIHALGERIASVVGLLRPQSDLQGVPTGAVTRHLRDPSRQ